MEHTVQDATNNMKNRRLPLIVTGAVLGLLVTAYLILCAVVSGGKTIFPNTMVAGSWDVGGLSRIQAEEQLSKQEAYWSYDTPITLFLSSPEDPESSPFPESDVTLTFGDLGGVIMDADATAQRAYAYCHDGNFFLAGYRYLRGLLVGGDISPVLRADQLPAQAAALAERLSLPPVDTSYTLGDNVISITKARDGFSVNSAKLGTVLADALASFSYADVNCPYVPQTAQELSPQVIYDEVAGVMKNAGFDPVTKTITAEEMGAEFNIDEARLLLNAAAPGQTVDVPALIQPPAVTAEQLKGVLFRDVLGTYSTHVGGTSARIGNVKLSAAAISGHILNTGDIFSYNEVVGQRTTANGYLPAPAYVKGETVDEVGGGICQTSSTLYMATLLSNLEIVTRLAHRYVPAYIPKGMDATVSWGGPEYRFANNTNYPIKITAAVSSKNYLTISIYGTKIDDTYVKITNEVLGSTPFETKYEDDASLPAGKEVVKQSPYTGYKVRTYRNVYSGDGKLLSSTFEASSDYKSRDKIIQRNPVVTPVDKPVELPTTPETGTPPGTTPGTGTPPTTQPGDTPGTGTTPGTTPGDTPGTGTAPGTETPSQPGQTTPPATTPGDGGFNVVDPSPTGGDGAGQ